MEELGYGSQEGRAWPIERVAKGSTKKRVAKGCGTRYMCGVIGVNAIAIGVETDLCMPYRNAVEGDNCPKVVRRLDLPLSSEMNVGIRAV